MPSLPTVLLCALTELLVSLGVGLPVTRRLVASRASAFAIAPIVGWAVFNGLALPVLTMLGFTRPTAVFVCASAIAGGIAALRRGSVRQQVVAEGVEVPLGLVTPAAVLAIVPMLAVWPKYAMGGVLLSEAMFDHSKAAIVDEIVRLGLPPGNPFFGDSGPRLVYYYLWHFSAAIPAAMFGANGWEADAALTWFSAFASLSLMIGLARMLGGNRTVPLVVVLLSLSASLRPALSLVLPRGFRDQALSQNPWPQSWLFQASWAPQHVMSAGCVVAAVLVLWRLAVSRDRLMVPLLAVIAAAGFESSAWVGGVIFGAAAPAITIAFLTMAENNRARVDLILATATAAILALVIAFPFTREEFAATAARHAGMPIAFRPFAVLGQMVPVPIRPFLNLAGYWLVLPAIEFPAVFFAGTWAIAAAVAARGAPTLTLPSPGVTWGSRGREGWGDRRLVTALALLAGTSFAVPWIFASTIANNDLGWRGVLPGLLILTAFAAVGLGRWLAGFSIGGHRHGRPPSPFPLPPRGERVEKGRRGEPPERPPSAGGRPGANPELVEGGGTRWGLVLVNARGWAWASCVVWALGLSGGLQVARDNVSGLPARSASVFAQAPALWAAVRRDTGPSERVANNPAFLADSVRWPVNISWALLADRRSCYAGWNLARAFAPLPEEKIDATDALFQRVFAGDGTRDDIRLLATDFDCHVVVLTPSDGAWLHDPFAASRYFRLVEEHAGKWRVYRIAGDAGRE
ncbi:MAG: hypothetical protein JO081_03890 [Alphaproteobacteria bacterium]|nr:hypothetical protein [Alphaproteobacteria bacterium]